MGYVLLPAARGVGELIVKKLKQATTTQNCWGGGGVDFQNQQLMAHFEN